jgi:hypothetical protein
MVMASWLLFDSGTRRRRRRRPTALAGSRQKHSPLCISLHFGHGCASFARRDESLAPKRPAPSGVNLTLGPTARALQNRGVFRYSPSRSGPRIVPGILGVAEPITVPTW